MSNPGVITLSDINIKSGGGFRVEDNLCESIHLHYKEIRIDLTIKELLDLSYVCENCIKDLIPAKNFNINDYDNIFLEKHAHCLVDLEQIDEIEVPIRDLLIKSKSFLKLPKCNRITNNKARKIIERKSEEKCIVIFNNTNVVVTGEMLIAKQYLKDPKSTVVVKHFVFEKNKHSYSEHPWVSYLFKWDSRRLIELARKILKRV